MAEGQVEIVAAGAGGEFAEGIEEVLGHAVEQIVGAEATADRVGVAAWGREFQVAGLDGVHGQCSSGVVQRQLVTSAASMPCSWA